VGEETKNPFNEGEHYEKQQSKTTYQKRSQLIDRVSRSWPE